MECIFDVSYINFAWGYKNSGTIIMPNGTAKKYDLSDMKGLDIDLETKIRRSDVVGKISYKTMNKLFELLENVRDVPFKTFGNIAHDAGGTSFKAYVRSTSKQSAWKKIPLATGGVEAKINPTAKELVLLLADLTDKKYFPGYNLFKEMETGTVSVQSGGSNFCQIF